MGFCGGCQHPPVVMQLLNIKENITSTHIQPVSALENYEALQKETPNGTDNYTSLPNLFISDLTDISLLGRSPSEFLLPCL